MQRLFFADKFQDGSFGFLKYFVFIDFHLPGVRKTGAANQIKSYACSAVFCRSLAKSPTLGFYPKASTTTCPSATKQTSHTPAGGSTEPVGKSQALY